MMEAVSSRASWTLKTILVLFCTVKFLEVLWKPQKLNLKYKMLFLINSNWSLFVCNVPRTPWGREFPVVSWWASCENQACLGNIVWISEIVLLLGWGEGTTCGSPPGAASRMFGTKASIPIVCYGEVSWSGNKTLTKCNGSHSHFQ